MSSSNNLSSIIIGSGSYIPENVVSGEAFLNHTFFDGGIVLDKSNEEIIQKFSEITEIDERRYACDNLVNSDMATIAAQAAIDDAGIDKESIDQIIFAHNFGDTKKNFNRIDTVPSLAAKVKEKLNIVNPDCVAYDLLFGCPGWVQAAINANYILKSGEASRILVIGSETLSRNIDPHDRDSMIFADGSGAILFEAQRTSEPSGIIAQKSQTYAVNYANLLSMGFSSNPEDKSGNTYLKMNGRKLYEFAVIQVPQVVKMAIDKAGICPEDVKMVFIHQANGKMDHAIMKRLFKLYGKDTMPEGIVPMTIQWLGNSSVATIPTLIDLVRKGKIENYKLNPGDYTVFASVGAGMHINAVVYKF